MCLAFQRTIGTLAIGLAAVVTLPSCGGGSSGSSNLPSVAVAAPTPIATVSGATPTPTVTPTIAPTTKPTIAPTAAPTATAIPVPNAIAAATYLTDNPGLIFGNPTYFSVSAATTTTPIDGVLCTQPIEQKQHFHNHLTVFANGIQYAIPLAIGLYHPIKLFGFGSMANPNPLVGWYDIDPADPTACHYDIHVHAADGVFHIEATTATQAFYLKDFLDIWGVTMSTTGFWKFTGPTRWFETDESTGAPGQHHVHEITGMDPSLIQLTKKVEFTVEIGTPLVPVPNYIFIESQL